MQRLDHTLWVAKYHMKMKVISQKKHLGKSQIFRLETGTKMTRPRLGVTAGFSMHLGLEFEELGCLRLYLWVEYNHLPSNIQRETGT